MWGDHDNANKALPICYSNKYDAMITPDTGWPPFFRRLALGQFGHSDITGFSVVAAVTALSVIYRTTLLKG